MKSQDYLSSAKFFPIVHVKKDNYFYQKIPIQDIQDSIAQKTKYDTI